MSRVAVIVLNYNGANVIAPCLRALRSQSYRDFEVVVVDNASTDGSLDIVRRDFPEARVMAQSRNLGFCGANNLAIAATDSEYLVLLNNDTEVEPDWLGCLVEALDSDPTCGFAASRMIRMSDKRSLDSAGDIFYSHGVAAKRGEGRPATEFSAPDYVFGACAGAAIYRRSLFESIGVLDPDFGSMGEDVDLSFRAQLRALKCRYVPNAIVYHHVGASFNRVPQSRVRLSRRNIVTVLIKNMPGDILARRFVRYLAYIIAGDIRWMLKGYSSAVLTARWENIRSLRAVLRKRAQIQKSRTISSSELEALFTPSRFLSLRRNAA
jgi:GT2 family glycosyltransferase